MRTKLDEAREIINEVDLEMIELFKQRMKASRMVAEYKEEHNLPILDAKREEVLKEKNLSSLNSVELEKYYLMFLEGMLEASKEYQKDLIQKWNDMHY